MKPDLDAIRARCDAATPGPWRVDGSTYDEDCNEHLAPYGLEGPNERLIWSSGGGEYTHPDMDTAQFIAAARTDIPALLAYIDTLEHMLAEERENVDTLRARVTDLEAEVAILRPWSVMLKRAHGALTDAGCVVPLEFDQSIEHAIKDLAMRATRAEQLFVDEYDARRDVERQRDELLRVNKGAAHHGIITKYVRELIELLGIQLQNPTANEAVDAAANEIKTLRTTVEELKARIAVLEAMR